MAMDFTAGAPAKKLTLTEGGVFAGNAAAQFQPVASFEFLPAEVK